MRESTITCPETIKKRNGTPVPFDIKKISSAIHKANDAAMVEAISPLEFEKLVTEIVESIRMVRFRTWNRYKILWKRS